MTIFYNIRPAERWKLIGLLSLILTLLVVSGFIERYKINDIRKNFSSIYADRLVPATEIYFITDHLYEKRFLLEAYLADPATDVATVDNDLIEKNRAIRQLMQEYAQTYLVHEESRHLKDLQNDLHHYQETEYEVVALLAAKKQATAAQLYQSKGKTKFEEIIDHLNSLAAIQSAVGKQLLANTNANFASTNLLLYLRSGASIIVAVLVLMLLFTSRMLHQPGQKFHLN